MQQNTLDMPKSWTKIIKGRNVNLAIGYFLDFDWSLGEYRCPLDSVIRALNNKAWYLFSVQPLNVHSR